MAPKMQYAQVSCQGGLNLRGTAQELMESPGLAEILENFEASSYGGYRRVSGYEPFGVNPVPGTGAIKGIHIFNHSIIVAKGNALYHSFDASTWIQINKVVENADLAAITAAPETPLLGTAEAVRFASLSNGTEDEHQMVQIVNGFDRVMYFEVNGSNHNAATYTFNFLDPATTGVPENCSIVGAFKDQFYVAGNPEAPSSIYISALFSGTDYSGTNSLQISTANPVVGIKPFRETMVVFCEDKIFTLAGVAEGQAVLKPISANIGCLATDSIQEVNGDLVYLAPDGIRTIAATTRIDDLELSAISTDISPMIREQTRDMEQIRVTSTVLREKNQYRLFFSRKAATLAQNTIGIIGTVSMGQQGSYWSWSTTKGVAPDAMAYGLFDGKYISLMSAFEEEGPLFQYDKGRNYNGRAIKATFETPWFSLGDASLRKNIHRLKVYLKPEGQSKVFYKIRNSGYGVELPYNNLRELLGGLEQPSLYGQAIYGTNTYGAKELEVQFARTSGSGFTFKIKYESEDDSDYPYTIDGFDIDFQVAGKV